MFSTQTAANILISGSTITLVAVGFSLIYRTTRFFNFAHAIVFTAGAYFTLVLTEEAGLSLWAACFISVLLCSLLGCLFELGVYRPLRHRGASAPVLLLASLGITVVFQNVISIAFGDEMRILSAGKLSNVIEIVGARVTMVQCLTVAAGVSSVLAIVVLLHTTKIGAVMKAVASDEDLAHTSGIEVERYILLVFLLGSAVVGSAGILSALDVNMRPNMGMPALLLGIVAVIIGGVDSIAGVVLGALLLATSRELGVWAFGSQWQDAIAFALLIVFLLVRPQGFLGKTMKKVSV